MSFIQNFPNGSREVDTHRPSTSYGFHVLPRSDQRGMRVQGVNFHPDRVRSAPFITAHLSHVFVTSGSVRTELKRKRIFCNIGNNYLYINCIQAIV